MISHEFIERAEKYLEWRCLDKNWFAYREKIGQPVDLRKMKFAPYLVEWREHIGDTAEQIDEYLNQHVKKIQAGEIEAPMGERPVGLYDKERAKMLETHRSYFANWLFTLMEQKNLTEAEISAKARIDAAFFDRLRNERKYEPEERTVWALVLALELSLDEANALMYRAKMFLSANVWEEVLMAFFLDNHIYNPDYTGEILTHYGFATLDVTEDFTRPPDTKIFHDDDLIARIDVYIEETFREPPSNTGGIKYSYSPTPLGEPAESSKTFDVIVRKLKDAVGLSGNLFSDYLLTLIKRKNLSEVEVYKRAHLDRRIFSKIRNEKTYMPAKKTVLAIAFAMKLDFKETNTLLARAGYFIDNQVFDLCLINEVLDYYDCPTLGD